MTVDPYLPVLVDPSSLAPENPNRSRSEATPRPVFFTMRKIVMYGTTVFDQETVIPRLKSVKKTTSRS